MKQFAIALMLAAFSCGAAAAWVKETDSLERGGFDIYADRATIREEGNMVQLWQLFVACDESMPAVRVRRKIEGAFGVQAKVAA